jgi:hypothetical protein
MSRHTWLVLLLATGAAMADDAPEAKRVPGGAEAAPPNRLATSERAQGDRAGTEQARKDEDAKLLSGMSVLGNQEAPKALVIVPWKTSELGRSPGITPMLDDSAQPVDKEVFIRALRYYEIRSETTSRDGAPVGGPETATADRTAAHPATAAQRRKS